LHRDVKPDNFMISKETNKVKVIDLGLVINLKLNNDVHNPMIRYRFQGTPNYGSINTLHGYNSSRRDDLESLGYSMMFLIDENSVPWRHMQT
jgi:serine/threonine protein kinase